MLPPKSNDLLAFFGSVVAGRCLAGAASAKEIDLDLVSSVVFGRSIKISRNSRGNQMEKLLNTFTLLNSAF